jgi:aldehyde dehydrogenase (NAD+)
VHRSEVAEAFINILGQVRTEFFGPDVEKSPEYGRLACVRSFKRVKAMLDKDKQYIKWGGEANADDKYDVIFCSAVWTSDQSPRVQASQKGAA